MADPKIRVGIIGANVTYGWGPRAHLPAILGLPEFELTAVCTAHRETSEASQKKFGAINAFHDYREMISHPDIDIVAVVVKVPQHHEMTMAALNAGKHVFTEWPLGANLEEAQEMADLARAKRVHTMVGMQRRCSPLYLRLKELIDDGYVGTILSCSLKQIGSGVQTRTSDRTWQKDASLGANTLTIAFGHAVDALIMCVGELSEVSAVISTQVKQWYEGDTGKYVDVTSPDNILVSGTLKNGAVLSAHVAVQPYHGSGQHLEIYGTKGTLVVDHGETRLLGAKSGQKELEEIAIPDRLTWIPSDVPQGPPFNVAQMYRRFGEAIISGERVPPDFDSALARHRLINAIEKSSREGIRQKI